MQADRSSRYVNETAAGAMRYELSRFSGNSRRRQMPMKPSVEYSVLTAGLVVSHHTYADGGIDVAADLGNFILVTGLGWICISIYLGIALKKVTGKKRYVFASPVIPWVSVLVLLLVATIIGISIDSLVSINSSLAESIGLYFSLILLSVVCALFFWKGKNKSAREITAHVLAPSLLASYLWLDAFII